MREVRVLVVEHSATVRNVLRRILSSAAGIEVVGEAAGGDEAVQQTKELEPDAILLDLDLPEMGGILAAKEISKRFPTPIVALAARLRRAHMQEQLLSIGHGGIGVFPKPEVPEEWEEFGSLLPETILQAGSLAISREEPRPELPPPQVSGHVLRYIAIGASTGGPGALRQVLKGLGTPKGVAIAVVQHIAAGFEKGLADWLAHELNLDVRVAFDGEVLQPGRVRLACSGSHMRIESGGVLRFDDTTAPIRGHRPSATELFRSFCDLCPANVAGVLLTGMGDDGVDGLLELREAGGLTITQDEASSAVFGMPRAAIVRGAAECVLPPAEIGRLLAKTIRETAS